MRPIEFLNSRWKPDWAKRSDLPGISTMFENAKSFLGAGPSKRAELVKRGTLTPAGITEEMRKFTEGPTADLQKAKTSLANMREAIAGQRAGLKPPKPDASDTAAIMLQGELRAWLRSLPLGERMAALMTNPDPAVLAAALQAPPALSGLSPDIFEKVQTLYVETAHPEKLAAIAEAEEAIELVEVAVQFAAKDLAESIGSAVPQQAAA